MRKFVKWVVGPLGLVIVVAGVVTCIWPPGTVDGVKLGATVGVTMFFSIAATFCWFAIQD